MKVHYLRKLNIMYDMENKRLGRFSSNEINGCNLKLKYAAHDQLHMYETT